MIESPLAAEMTWAAANEAITTLRNGRIEAALADEEPRFPWDCVAGEKNADPFTARILIVATPARVVASDYRVVSSTLPADAVECVETFYAGEAVVEANPGYPFLELSVELEISDALFADASAEH